MTHLKKLQAKMHQENIKALYIPKNDLFMGENVRPCDERLAWVSGFAGSAGFALVMVDVAYLFVDGRYTLQAGAEAPEFRIIDWPDQDIWDILPPEMALTLDPDLLPLKRAQDLEARGIRLDLRANLIDGLWADRPSPAPVPVYELDIKLAGLDRKDKIKQITQEFVQKNVSGFLSNHPENAAWLLNMRGGEVKFLPAPLVLTFVGIEGDVHVFGIRAPAFLADIHFYPLEDIGAFLKKQGGSIGFDPARLPLGLYRLLHKPVSMPDPIIAAKARKNPAELAVIQAAHLKDGVAMVRFLDWVYGTDPLALDEHKASEKLLALRKDIPGFIEPSFATISGFNGNGAIVHYHHDQKNPRCFEKDGVYLIDSGGQFPGATTDITRTLAIGAGIAAARRPYTAVLSGVARLSMQRFPSRTKGRELDPIARAALWNLGLDYNHGTGHGVGAGLSVHEGPQSISRLNEVALEDGMIVSIEPGYYKTDHFGIRIENLAVIRFDDDWGHFETLTLAPIDLDLIDKNTLAPDVRLWLNAYHKRVFEALAPHLDERLGAVLKKLTTSI